MIKLAYGLSGKDALMTQKDYTVGEEVHMQVRIKNINRIAWIVVLFMLFVLHLNVSAAENGDSVARVGYYEDGDYMYHNAQGEYEGYNFEFLQEVSKLGGLSYEVVDSSSWQEAFSLLREGKIDILPAVYRTEERMEQMLFTDESMCTIYTTLNVRSDDTRYNYEDFDAFQGMKVGIIRGGEDGESFKRYCSEHGVTLTIIEYDETQLLLDALEDGTLDGVAITHLGRSSVFRSVAQFAPTPMYIAVSKQRPDLLAQINRAINDILLRNPDYRTDLYDKYLSPSANQTPALTKEEAAYIESLGEPIRISYDSSLAPLSYKNAEGEFDGIMAEVFERIGTKSGLTFEFEDRPASAALTALKNGETDVISVVDGDYLWDERNHMNTTLRFLHTPSVMITQAERPDVKVLALPSGYQLSERIAQSNQDKEILYLDSVEACFDAVLAGEAQAAYTNTQVANYLISDPKYEKLYTTTLTQYPSDLCIGVSKSADPRLFSILDKYIQYMSNEEIDAMLLNNSTNVRPITVEAFVRQNIWLIAGLVAIVFGSIILLLCINLMNISRSNRRIQNLLYRDELTGLDNINRFYVRARELLSAEPTANYAVIYCDIDHFKLINDTFGFEEGDEVLRSFGSILQRFLQEKELCARLSADNFVMLKRYGQWDMFTACLEQMQTELNQWRKEREIVPYEIVISFGAYPAENDGKQDIKQMLDLANYAMRSAKTMTGVCVVLYDEQMRNKALFEQELEGRLDAAVEQQEFEAYFQPKVDMITGEIVGCEALVRWNHPERGLLMPNMFVPFFERKGLIVQVDLYMFDQVCRTVRKWLDEGFRVVTVSCNFSQLHFEHTDFVRQISKIADRYQVPHQLLEVEITESTIASGAEGLAPVLMELKQHGFQIAIDDFGSGYSSLGQLQRLMADVLKLDRSFVCAGLQGPRELIVIDNLVTMAFELGMEVVCEGVETEAQCNVLREIGCRIAQGYYYYRPLQTEAFERLLDKNNNHARKDLV